MRKPRPIVSPEEADGWHHLYTRTVNREIFFTHQELAIFLDLIHRTAEYCRVFVRAHTEMGTHPHLQVQIPKREPISDEEILRLYSILHPDPSSYSRQRIESMKRSLQETGVLTKKERQRHLAQMYSKSRYMQLLKPRFTKIFNKAHNRIGPLWNERYQNQVLPDEPRPHQTVSVYIDLNALRAGLCQDPKDYSFCGYAEAIAGSPTARAGIMTVMNAPTWEEAFPPYCKFVYDQALVYRQHKVRISQESYESGLAQTLIEERIREQQHAYLIRGGAIGSASFVQTQIDLYRKQTGKGQRLRPFPVPLGIGLDGFYVMNRPRLRHF